MKTFVYEGQEVQVPDDMSDEDVLDLLIGNDSTGSASAEFPAVTPSDSWFGDVNPDTLSKNPDWLRASSILYKGSTGKEFEGTEQDLAEYGLDQMGWFNYNLPRMAYDAARLQSAPPEMQKAFLYLMETYDNLEITWSGTGRFIKGVTADPTTYVGLGTLGIGTAASQATKVASKQGIKSLIRAGVVAGLEGAMQAGVSDASRQSVEISAGKSTEFDTGRLAANTAIGAGVGAVLGGALDAGATVLRGASKAEPTPPDIPNPPYVPKEKPVAAPAVTPEGPDQLSLDLVQPMQTKQPDLFPDAPLEGRLDQLPAFAQPSPKESMSDMEDRLMEKWGISHQRELDLGTPPEGPFAYSGQGELFSRQGLPEQTAPVKPQTAAELKTLQAAGKAQGGENTIKSPKVAAGKAAAVEPPTGLQKALDFVKSLNDQTDGKAGERIVEIIKNTVSPEGWRIIPGGRVEIAKSVEEATDLLSRLNVSNAEEARAVLNEVALGGPQRQALVTAISEASDKLTQMRLDLTNSAISAKSKGEAVYLLQQINKIAKAQDTVAKLQLESSSASGSLLQNQAGRLITGSRREFASPEQIMSRNPGMTAEQANEAFVRAFEDAKAEAYKDETVKRLTASIQKMYQSGDWSGLYKAVAERNALVNDITADKAGVDRNWFTALSAKASEAAIGNVFSVQSAVVNTLPSMAKLLYKPSLNALMDNRASIRSVGAAYSTMFSQSRAALNAAKAVFNLEINPNFSNKSDFLSGTPEIKGVLGRVIRFFPRFLEATDAFFSRLHYAGFVASETYNDATERLIKKGLKPSSKEFKAEMDKVMQEMQDNLFTKEADVVEVADTLYQIGTARGYTGKKLEEFIKLEINRNPELFQKATNIAGRDYAVDVLFKREFTGDTFASRMAQNYERMMNSHPLMRVGFQLFVRTPIRVFEEGFRLTPGLNLASSAFGSKFLDDLRGFNGASRQIRAQGEALLSMAFGGAVLGMYANGMITGGGPIDYKQRRGKENDREWQPYTIYLPGGTTISFRNLDPFATPLKIIVNSLDRLQMYQYRKAQGEYDNDPTGNVAALAGVAGMSILQAVKDANLTDGLNQMVTLVDIFSDPEKNENKIANFFNEKAKLLIPNSIGKTRQLLSGEATPMSDIATTGQALSQRFNPFDETVPVQRDALGNKRYMAYSIPAYFGIGVNTNMEKNITKEEQEVLKVLADLQTVNNVSFTLPYKIEALGNVDLRAEYMPDGKTTWYDRIYDIYRDLGVADALHQGLVANGDLLTWGVADPNKYGTKLQFARDTISKYREAAVEQFIRERQEARIKAYQRINDKSQAKAGAFDVPIIPQ